MRMLMIPAAMVLVATNVASACPAVETATTAKASPVVQSPGKGTADIAIGHRLLGKAAVGQPLQLDIELAAPGDARLLVDVNAPAELGFAAGRLRREVAGGDTLSLQLAPQAHGRFYVNVVARKAAHGPARVVSIPIQVGVPVSRASKAVTTPRGELIVRLPAAD